MRHAILTAIMGITLIQAPAFAADCVGLGTETVLGKTEAEVTESLKAMGYEIRKAETDDGKIEVYFVKDSATGEVYVGADTGRVIKLSYESN